MKQLDIYNLRTHIVCKAKAFLDRTLEQKPIKSIISYKKEKTINDFILNLLAGKSVNLSINSSIDLLFADMDLDDWKTDYDALFINLTNFYNMLKDNDYEIVNSVTPFDINYNGIIINSRYNLSVKSLKTNIIHPAIVDLSNTKYDIFFNPISYHAQTVCDFLKDNNVFAPIVVFTTGSGKCWEYNNKRYGDIIHASINEAVIEIKSDFCGVRFGWWCRNCYYRGICGGLLGAK